MPAIKCCAMQAYFRPDTPQNRAAWAIFAASIVMGFIFTPLGASRLNACGRKYNKCLQENHLTMESDYKDVCTQTLYDCNALDWYRVFIWGIIFFFVAGIALCYFWCCAVPPGYQHSLGSTAYTVTGTSYMVGPAPVTGHPMETQPLFHPGMHYSSSAPQPHVYSSMQFAMSHGQGMPPPPPYQFAQLYPTHTPGISYMPTGSAVQMQNFVPPTYTVTLSAEPPTLDNEPSLAGGIAPGLAAGTPITPDAAPSRLSMDASAAPPSTSAQAAALTLVQADVGASAAAAAAEGPTQEGGEVAAPLVAAAGKVELGAAADAANTSFTFPTTPVPSPPSPPQASSTSTPAQTSTAAGQSGDLI